MRGHLRRVVQHPMLLGLGIWATVHLLANGDLRGTVLFGAFLAYAAIDLVSAVQRGAVKTFLPEGKFDAMAIVGGTAVALVVMLLHRYLFGVPQPDSACRPGTSTMTTSVDSASRRELSGKVALVTGGARNIGRAIACALAAGGADVMVSALHAHGDVDQTVRDIEASGSRGASHIADVTDPMPSPRWSPRRSVSSAASTSSSTTRRSVRSSRSRR
jgi:hypothetical protein